MNDKMKDIAHLTWNLVMNLLAHSDADKNFIDGPISRDLFLEDLYYLKNVYLDKFLQREPNFVSTYLKEMLDPQNDWSFPIKQLHRHKKELQSLENIPGFAQLCQQLPTHPGYIAQLEATYYINRFLTIKAIEYKAGKQDIDIVCMFESEEIFIHVKDLRQQGKNYNQMMAWVHLNNAMRVMNIRNKEGALLTVHFVEGYVPDNIPEIFWFNAVEKISHKPSIHTVQIINEINNEIESIQFTTEWSSHGVAVGEFSGIDRFWLVKFKLSEIENKIPASNTQKNFLLGVAEFPRTFEFDRNVIESAKISGVFMLDWNLDMKGEKLLFHRSDIYCKVSEHNLEEKLSVALPYETID